MSVETHRVLIGACGWKHKAWLNDFYDDDLPEEWQLGFYSNAFPVVYVPAGDWVDVVDLNEWKDEVADTFRFILEIPADIANDTDRFAAALIKVKKLGDFCLGLVFHVNQVAMENVSIFRTHVQLALDFVPVCIDKQNIEFTAEFSKFLREKNISEVWRGDFQDRASLNRGSLAISRVASDELDMAALRKVVEISLSASSENCISVLCLDGNPPSLEKFRSAEIILNLL